MNSTINDEKLGIEIWTGKHFNALVEVPNRYYHFEVDFYPDLPDEADEELSDEEILSLPEKIGMFSFLSDSEEDIYSESDGMPL